MGACVSGSLDGDGKGEVSSVSSPMRVEAMETDLESGVRGAAMDECSDALVFDDFRVLDLRGEIMSSSSSMLLMLLILMLLLLRGLELFRGLSVFRELVTFSGLAFSSVLKVSVSSDIDI